MAYFIFNKASNELIVGANEKLVILDLLDYKIKQVIEIPEKLHELIVDNNDATVEDDDEVTNNQQNNENKLKNLQFGKIIIQNIALSPNGEFIAVATGGVKSLILYGRKELKWEVLSIRKSNRTSSVITFSPNSEIIVLCDKSGDCFQYDCKNHLSPNKWILGHLSSIYDVKFSLDGKYILTADRDEKVRVTNFPHSYEIESYCLGHREYVCCIQILQENPEFLVSLSGDKTLRVWQWKTGTEVAQHEIQAPGVKMAIRILKENSYELAVLVFQPNHCLYIYKLDINNADDIEIKEEKSITLQSSIVINIIYVEEVLIASIFNNNKLQIEFIQTNVNSHPESLKNIKINIEKEFSSQQLQEPEDISGWFKKKFDNVSEYLQRKKLRIEEKSSKRKC